MLRDIRRLGNPKPRLDPQATVKSLAVTGLVFVALMANSPVMPEATTVSPGQPCQTVGAFTGARHVTAPKRVLIGDRLVFSSPAFSFVVPKEWRLAKGADLERIEIFQSVKAQIQKAKDAMKVALGLDPAAPFELADTFWLFKLAKTFTVLTNSAGAYVSVDLTDNPTGTRYLPGCQLYELERAEFWAEFSRVTVEQASQPVTLAFRLLEVKEYRD